jgi:3-oxoacyl-[acyl-carrier protein] reductase
MSDARVALVTGASRGIGLAIAKALAASPAGIEQGVGQGLAAALPLDVTDANSIDALFATLGERALLPLVLINNAGITRDNLLLRMKDEEWRQVVSANLDAVFALSRRALKTMLKARFGRIVSITSVVAASGNPGQANYAAAKAGVIGLSKSLAAEVASRGVTVNTVAPGFIDTDMTRKLDDAQRANLLARIPLARMGSVEEVASLVAYLASDAAGYITGETIHVNGGLYMS